MSNALVQAQSVTNSLNTLLMNQVLLVLSLFSLKLEGLLLAALSARGKQIGRAVGISEAMAFGSASARFSIHRILSTQNNEILVITSYCIAPTTI